MPLNDHQISAIEHSVSSLLHIGTPLIPELRKLYPGITFVRCDAEHVQDAEPYRSGTSYQLYLLNRNEVCLHLTDTPAHADGIIIVPVAN